jgi:hypothetical protein
LNKQLVNIGTVNLKIKILPLRRSTQQQHFVRPISESLKKKIISMTNWQYNTIQPFATRENVKSNFIEKMVMKAKYFGLKDQ